MSRRVVVTGMGAVTPIGNNVKDFWENVKRNRWNRTNYEV